ncbi:hypothetical protein ACGFIX_16070 [Nocardia salmonicida]|uniref:hypothetical protein n=1 Tax=Nocardia salmonicida TaxID=53431 RepID=UPI00371A2919
MTRRRAAEARVRFPCPACEYCLSEVRRFRWIALLAAVLAWSRSGYFADVWMNATADRLIVSAHPDFVAAVERNRADTR